MALILTAIISSLCTFAWDGSCSDDSLSLLHKERMPIAPDSPNRKHFCAVGDSKLQHNPNGFQYVRILEFAEYKHSFPYPDLQCGYLT